MQKQNQTKDETVDLLDGGVSTSSDIGLKTIAQPKQTNQNSDQANYDDRSILFPIFTPKVFLEVGAISTYLDLLQYFVSTTSNLSVEEEDLLVQYLY